MSQATKEVKDVAQVVSDEKYFINSINEDWFGLARRCAKFMAAAESTVELMKYWEERFYELIVNQRFIPGGRILANAGTYFDDLNELQRYYLQDYIKNYPSNEKRCGQMLNCYVLEIKDSKHGEQGIYETLEDAADITAMEGGVGENFSALRPKGFPIKGNPKYKSSGPISFLKIFDASSKQLRQGGGRRGANMAVLNCDHPDIMEFITCKAKEGDIDNYNISVGITDAFMNAAIHDLNWDLMWENKAVQTISAKDLLRKIAEHSHKDSDKGGGAGDPGFIFLDTVGKLWPFQNKKPNCSNPCVTGDTQILTSVGFKTVQDLIGNHFSARVYNNDYLTISGGFFSNGIKDVYRLETVCGKYSLKITDDHEIYTSLISKKPAKELKCGENILTNNGSTQFKSLTKIGKEEVYDVTLSGPSRFVANGIIVSNCGEQILNSDEACDLGAMNFYAYFIENDGKQDGIFDFVKYEEDIVTAIRFLDNVLTMNNYPLKYRNDRSRKITMSNRRIGLGIMGLADILMAMGIPYDDFTDINTSEDNFIDEVMGLLASQSNFASFQLGKEKGPFLSHLNAIENYRGRRNCCVTTIAPTGTTSMLAGVNGGCEPFFGLVTKKNTTDGSGNVYYMVPDSFKHLCFKHRVELTPERLEEIYNNKGSVQGLHWVPDHIQAVAKTTMDLTPQAHIAMQCRLQKYIENSISKTINLPNSASVDDVYNSIISLWKGGAKGGTIYRDGSRKFQILNVGGPKKAEEVDDENNCGLEERPMVLQGQTHKTVIDAFHKPENAYITVNESNGKPVEVFLNYSNELNQNEFFEFLMHNNVPKETAEIICSKFSLLSKENTGIVTRLISLCLRYNVPIPAIIKQLNKISVTGLYSLPKRIAKILGSYVADGTDTKMTCQNVVEKKICGGQLVFQEGCFRCVSCGDSKCN